MTKKTEDFSSPSSLCVMAIGTVWSLKFLRSYRAGSVRLKTFHSGISCLNPDQVMGVLAEVFHTCPLSIRANARIEVTSYPKLTQRQSFHLSLQQISVIQSALLSTT